MKDIMTMNTQELQEYTNSELNKAGYKIITEDYSDLPEEFVTAVEYINENIYDCSFFKEDKHKLAFIEEYIPMMGKVWRIFIYDILKAQELIKQAVDTMKVIGSSQVVSIYYDNADVLGIMGQPYFEIYDGDDVERFLGNEYKNLYNCIEDVLSRIIH